MNHQRGRRLGGGKGSQDRSGGVRWTKVSEREREREREREGGCVLVCVCVCVCVREREREFCSLYMGDE